ncbi:hypothetical protein AAMO2058_000417100 [Amorphochlora amoebiformis]
MDRSPERRNSLPDSREAGNSFKERRDSVPTLTDFDTLEVDIEGAESVDMASRTISARSGTLGILQKKLKSDKTEQNGQKAQFVKAVALKQAVRCLHSIDDMVWVASRDGTIHVRDNLTGKLIKNLSATRGDSKTAHKFFVNTIMRRGKNVWLGSSDGFLHRFEICSKEHGPKNYKQMENSLLHSGGIMCSAIDDANYWTAGQDSQIVQDGNMNLKLLGHKGWIRSMVLDKKRGELWSCAEDGIRVWKVPVQESVGDSIFTISRGKKAPEVLCLKQINDTIWSGSANGLIEIWDLGTKNRIKAFAVGPRPAAVTTIEKVLGSVWAGGGARNQLIRIFDAETTKSTGEIRITAGTVTCMQFASSRVWIGSRSPGKCYLYRVFSIHKHVPRRTRARREEAKKAAESKRSSPQISRSPPVPSYRKDSPLRRPQSANGPSSPMRAPPVKTVGSARRPPRRGSYREVVKLMDPERAKTKYRHKQMQTERWECQRCGFFVQELKDLQQMLLTAPATQMGRAMIRRSSNLNVLRRGSSKRDVPSSTHNPTMMPLHGPQPGPPKTPPPGYRCRSQSPSRERRESGASSLSHYNEIDEKLLYAGENGNGARFEAGVGTDDGELEMREMEDERYKFPEALRVARAHADRYTELKKTLEGLKESAEMAEANERTKDEMLRGLEAEFTKAQEEIQKLLAANDKLRKETGLNTRDKEKLEYEIDDLRTQIGRLGLEKKALTESYERELQTERGRLEAAQKEHERLLAAANNIRHEAETEWKAQEMEFLDIRARFEEEIVKYQEETNIVVQDRDQLKEEIKYLKSEIEQEKADKDQLEKSLERANAASTAEKEALRAAVRSSASAAESAEEKVESLCKEISNLNTKYKQALKEQKETYEKELAARETALKSAASEQSNQVVEEHNQKMSAVQGEVKAMKELLETSKAISTRKLILKKRHNAKNMAALLRAVANENSERANYVVHLKENLEAMEGRHRLDKKMVMDKYSLSQEDAEALIGVELLNKREMSRKDIAELISRLEAKGDKYREESKSFNAEAVELDKKANDTISEQTGGATDSELAALEQRLEDGKSKCLGEVTAIGEECKAAIHKDEIQHTQEMGALHGAHDKALALMKEEIKNAEAKYKENLERQAESHKNAIADKEASLLADAASRGNKAAADHAKALALVREELEKMKILLDKSQAETKAALMEGRRRNAENMAALLQAAASERQALAKKLATSSGALEALNLRHEKEIKELMEKLSAANGDATVEIEIGAQLKEKRMLHKKKLKSLRAEMYDLADSKLLSEAKDLASKADEIESRASSTGASDEDLSALRKRLSEEKSTREDHATKLMNNGEAAYQEEDIQHDEEIKALYQSGSTVHEAEANRLEASSEKLTSEEAAHDMEVSALRDQILCLQGEEGKEAIGVEHTKRRRAMRKANLMLCKRIHWAQGAHRAAAMSLSAVANKKAQDVSPPGGSLKNDGSASGLLKEAKQASALEAKRHNEEVAALRAILDEAKKAKMGEKSKNLKAQRRRQGEEMSKILRDQALECERDAEALEKAKEAMEDEKNSHDLEINELKKKVEEAQGEEKVALDADLGAKRDAHRKKISALASELASAASSRTQEAASLRQRADEIEAKANQDPDPEESMKEGQAEAEAKNHDLALASLKESLSKNAEARLSQSKLLEQYKSETCAEEITQHKEEIEALHALLRGAAAAKAAREAKERERAAREAEEAKKEAKKLKFTDGEAHRLRIIGEYLSATLNKHLPLEDPTSMTFELVKGRVLAELVQTIDPDLIDVRAMNELKLPAEDEDKETTKREISENLTLISESLQAAGLELPDIDVEKMSSVDNSSAGDWRELAWAIVSHSLNKNVIKDTPRVFWRDIPLVTAAPKTKSRRPSIQNQASMSLPAPEKLHQWAKWRLGGEGGGGGVKKGVAVWGGRRWEECEWQAWISGGISDWHPPAKEDEKVSSLLNEKNRAFAIGKIVKSSGSGEAKASLAEMFARASGSEQKSLTSPEQREDYRKAYTAVMYNIWRDNGAKETIEGEDGKAFDDAEAAKAAAEAARGKKGDRKGEDSTRLESQLRNWVNRLLSYRGKRRVRSLYTSVRDGLLLLRVLDTLSPGIVPWKEVEMNPKNKFKKLTNNNLAVKIAMRPPFAFSLVGIAGSDLVEGNEKLTLALVWQLMRYQLFQNLGALLGASGGGAKAGRGSINSDKKKPSKKFSDKTLITHANAALAAAQEQLKTLPYAPTGSALGWLGLRLKGFSDEHLKDSKYLACLLWAVTKTRIPWSVLDSAELVDNARLVISLSRKQGATVYLQSKDVVEVRSDMLVTLVAAILGLSTK